MEGKLPQGKAAGLTTWRGSHQVEGYVEELQTQGEARGYTPPWAGTMNA